MPSVSQGWAASKTATGEVRAALDAIRTGSKSTAADAARVLTDLSELERLQDRKTATVTVGTVFVVIGVCVAWYTAFPALLVPDDAPRPTSLSEFAAMSDDYVDWSRFVAQYLVVLLAAAGGILGSQWVLGLGRGPAATALHTALDATCAEPVDLEHVAECYGRVETALLVMTPSARTQAAQTHLRGWQATAAAEVGELELRLDASTDWSAHRRVLATALARVVDGSWPRDAPPEHAIADRLSAATRLPAIRRLGGFAAIAGLIPVAKGLYSVLQLLTPL